MYVPSISFLQFTGLKTKNAVMVEHNRSMYAPSFTSVEHIGPCMRPIFLKMNIVMIFSRYTLSVRVCTYRIFLFLQFTGLKTNNAVMVEQNRSMYAPSFSSVEHISVRVCALFFFS